MYSKKHIELRYVILIILVIIAIVLGVVSKSVKEDRKLNYIEQSIKDSAVFINKIFYMPIKWVNSKIKEANEKKDLYNKYRELQKKVSEIELNDAKRAEMESLINKLQDTLKLNSNLADDSYLNATVVNRNIGYWYNTVTIDKGSTNGVTVDMAVITNDGLIGKVTKTTNFNSVVKLLTSNDVNNKISVKIQVGDKFVYGLLSRYDYKNNTFTVKGIDENIDIPKGSLVITTGMGGLFPSGILVGYVDSVTADNFDLSQIVQVKSNVNFDDLVYVTILKRADGV